MAEKARVARFENIGDALETDSWYQGEFQEQGIRIYSEWFVWNRKHVFILIAYIKKKVKFVFNTPEHKIILFENDIRLQGQKLQRARISPTPF